LGGPYVYAAADAAAAIALSLCPSEQGPPAKALSQVPASGLSFRHAHAGHELGTDLLGGPYAYAAADAAAAIGLTLCPPEQAPPAYRRAPSRLAPVWEGEQVAESPYQRFMQVQIASHFCCASL